MHEYSIAASLLKKVQRSAAEHEASRVLRVHLRVGELAGVEVELLRTAWSLVCQRSRCEGSELSIRCVPTRWQCSRCESAAAPGSPLRCEHCGAPARLAGGDELMLDRIEMEVA